MTIPKLKYYFSNISYEAIIIREDEKPLTEAQAVEVIRIVEESRWIPVSERLPEEGLCLVLCEGHIYEVKVRFSDDEWEDSSGKVTSEATAICDILYLGSVLIGHDECITHWKPIILPKAEDD